MDSTMLTSKEETLELTSQVVLLLEIDPQLLDPSVPPPMVPPLVVPLENPTPFSLETSASELRSMELDNSSVHTEPFLLLESL